METEPEHHSPPPFGAHAERPKGILKNRSSQGTLPTVDTLSPTSPGDKDVTLQNTIVNAGPRRSSSGARGTTSRRTSGTPVLAVNGTDDDSNMRLKWDEANLYLTEQEKSSTMKITEPKTPYAKRYDPAEDEAELSKLNAADLDVDELDRKQSRVAKNDEIPDLDIGEPEEGVPAWEENLGGGRMSRSGSMKGKQVVVDDEAQDPDQGHQSEDEAKKHKEFAEMRKKHYEMRDVKTLLGHPEDNLDDDDEEPPLPKKLDEDVQMNGV